ncbi:MAG: HD domain-containing protein [Candidatus Neomarinimicrobiota bacterium]
MKTTAITDYSENTTVQGFFLCLEKNLRTTKLGDYYLDLLLQDATGRIPARIWEDVDHFGSLFEAGDPIAAKGIVENFRGTLQLNVSHIARATKERYGRYGFREELLVPVIAEDPRKLWETLRRMITGIRNKHLKALLRGIFKSHKAAIMELPASLKYHHTERGGFLLHVVSTGEIATFLSDHYPRIDRDLLITGTLLHDIGRVRAVTRTLEAEYTEEGQLMGHVILGRDIVREAIAEIEGFPPELALQLEHIILAHPGTISKETPRYPRFPEALLVHMIDTLDGRLDLMFREIQHDSGEGPFTSAHNYFRTLLWKQPNR